MAAQKKLKQKLKASAKRRQRRMDQSQSTQAGLQAVDPDGSVAQVSMPRVDVLDLVAKAILACAEDLSTSSVDAVVVAALRSCQKNATPSGDEAQQVAALIGQVLQHDGVNEKAYHQALRQLLTMANEHADDEHGDGFTSYLSLLCK